MKATITILLLFITSLTFGQNNARLEKIKALRVAFLASKLELTPSEAEKFWPIFNEFDNKQSELRKEKRKIMNQLKPQNSTSLSENSIQKLFETSETLDVNIQDNKQQLTKNLKGIISTKKIILLKQLEEDFKKTLLKQMKNSKR